MHKILVCDSIADEGLEILRSVGQVEVRTGLSEAELASAVEHAAAIVVRSSTQITAPILEAARECQIVARAGVGVDNIDVPAATRRGILVVNSPAGNILAAAEHTMALLLAAARHVPQADRSMKAGEWDRKHFAGRQIEGKTLGLIGFGNVGRAVAKRGKALGMRVVAYDPYVTEERAAADGVELVSLEQVLSQAHFISLHAVATAASEGLIGERELSLVRPDAILVNTARGALIDEKALVSALRAGRLAGAALDVFAEEPTGNIELVSLPNVIATPHVGALTEEAQVNVAVDAARQVADVLAGRPPRWPVNAPVLPSEALETLAPMVPLARALGRLSRSLLQGPLRSLEMLCSETLTSDHLRYLTGVALATLLEGTTEEPVNVVNARVLAEERHVEVGEGRSSEDRGYTNLLELQVRADEVVTVWGALLDRDRPRIVNVDGYEMDLPPVGLTLLVWREGHGRPGFVGRVGSLLGDAGISITAIQVSQRSDAGVGLMALSVRSEIPTEVLRQIGAEAGVIRTCTVDFGS